MESAECQDAAGLGVYELVVQDEVMAMKPEIIIGAIQDGDAQS